MPPSPDPWPRIAKSALLLSSSVEGEVLAAAASIARQLAAAGLTWHDFAGRLDAAPAARWDTHSSGRSRESGRRPHDRARTTVDTWADAVTHLFDHHIHALDEGFELDFVESNIGRFVFSDKQIAVLRRLCVRFRIRVLEDAGAS